MYTMHTCLNAYMLIDIQLYCATFVQKYMYKCYLEQCWIKIKYTLIESIHVLTLGDSSLILIYAINMSTVEWTQLKSALPEYNNYRLHLQNVDCYLMIMHWEQVHQLALDNGYLIEVSLTIEPTWLN